MWLPKSPTMTQPTRLCVPYAHWGVASFLPPVVMGTSTSSCCSSRSLGPRLGPSEDNCVTRPRLGSGMSIRPKHYFSITLWNYVHIILWYLSMHVDTSGPNLKSLPQLLWYPHIRGFDFTNYDCYNRKGNQGNL